MASKPELQTSSSTLSLEGDASSVWETGPAARLVDYFLVVKRGESIDKPTESIQLDGLRYAREVVSQVPETEWPDLPLTPNIAMFVFPVDIELAFVPRLGQPFDRQPTTHRFVCTKLDGSRQFCVAFQFWQKMSQKDLMILTQQQSLVLKKALEDSKDNPEVMETIKESWVNELERLKLLMLDLSLAVAKQEENFEECIRIKAQKIEFEQELKQRRILLPTLFDQLNVYEPVAICLASQYPAFNLFEMFLKNFYRVSLFPSTTSLGKLLNQFMFELPVPRPGPLRLQYTFGDTARIFGRASPKQLPLATGSYKLLFRLLALEDIVNIFLSLLTEGSVVFCSSSWAVLGHVTEAFLGLIFPFTWEGVYMPVLPLCLWDFMAAPVPFIAGIHSSYLDTMPQPEEVVFVDLDKGEVYVPNLEGVPTLPPETRAKFLGKLLKYADIYDVNSKKEIFTTMGVAFPNREHLRPLANENVGAGSPLSPSALPSPTSASAVPLSPYDFTNDILVQNDLEFSLPNIRETFLGLLAKFFKNYRKYCWLDEGLPTFDTVKFVNSHPKGPLRALLTTMVNSQMFNVFVDRAMKQGTPDPTVALFDDFLLRNMKTKKAVLRFPPLPCVTSPYSTPSVGGPKEFVYEQFPLYLEGLHTRRPVSFDFSSFTATATTTAAAATTATTTSTATTSGATTTSEAGEAKPAPIDPSPEAKLNAVIGTSPWSATTTAMSTTAAKAKGPPARRAPTKAAPKRWIDIPPPPPSIDETPAATAPVAKTPPRPTPTPTPTPTPGSPGGRVPPPAPLKFEVDESLAKQLPPPARTVSNAVRPTGYRQELEGMLLAKSATQLRDNLTHVLNSDSALKQAQQRRVSRISEIDPAAAKLLANNEVNLRGSSNDPLGRGQERQRGMSRWAAAEEMAKPKPPTRPEDTKVPVPDFRDPASLTLVCVIKNSSLTYPQALNRVAKARALLTGVFSESDNTIGKHYNIEDDGDDDGIDDPRLIASWLEGVHKDTTNSDKVIPKLFEPRQQRQTRRAAQEKAKLARKKAKQETLAEKKKTAVLRERGSEKIEKGDKNEAAEVEGSSHRVRQVSSVGSWKRGHRTLTRADTKAKDALGEETVHFPGCVREGFLKKQGAKVHSWKRRYFVLQNGKLMYFENVETMRLKGQMIVDRLSTVGSHAQDNAFWFCPVPGGRSFDIEADDSRARDAWLESIRQVIYASIAADSDGVISTNVPKFKPSNHTSDLHGY